MIRRGAMDDPNEVENLTDALGNFGEALGVIGLRMELGVAEVMRGVADVKSLDARLGVVEKSLAEVVNGLVRRIADEVVRDIQAGREEHLRRVEQVLRGSNGHTNWTHEAMNPGR